MKIYTSNAMGEDLKHIHHYGMGILCSSDSRFLPRRHWEGIPVALDNGAFPAFQKGRGFNEYAFLKALDCIYNLNLDLQFIVLPDIVTGGMKSLDFSMSWADRLHGNNLAFVVQDGMSLISEGGKINLTLMDDRISTIFVGGSVEWKWKTAKDWVDIAHKNGKKCHIGQCGKIEYLRRAKEIGADSCDSASFVRNKTWHLLDEFEKPERQTMLFKDDN